MYAKNLTMHLSPLPTTLLADESQFGAQAAAMVERQLIGHGLTDRRVLAQMRSVPRHLFVADRYRDLAYEDRALPTMHDQTISQPYIVALMTQMLDVRDHHRVLEIGTGSGYQTMILARLADHVTTIERDRRLYDQARRVFDRFALDNVDSHHGDGSLGYPPSSPYDRILVTAAAPKAPPSLVDQLSDKQGRMVIPLGDRHVQQLVQIIRDGARTVEMKGIGVRFVPLVGREGWSDQPKG